MTVPEGGCGGADFTQGTRRLRAAEEPEHRQSGPGGKPGGLSLPHSSQVPGLPACLFSLRLLPAREPTGLWLLSGLSSVTAVPSTHHTGHLLSLPPSPATADLRLPGSETSGQPSATPPWDVTFSFTLLLWAWGPFPGSRPQGRSVSNPENTGFCRLPTDPTLLPRGFLRRCLRCRFTCWHVLWAPDGTGHPVSKSNLHSVKKPLHPVSAVTPLSLPTTFPMLC